MNSANVSVIPAALLMLGGCCSANLNVLEKSETQATVVALSRKESCCIEKAKERADEWCKEHGGKTASITSQEATYQGADKTASAMAGVLLHRDLSSSEDYKATLEVECK